MKLLNTSAGIILAAMTVTTAAAGQNGHNHIGHAADSFRGTPEGAGLLSTAQMEAEVAAQHAGLAVRGGSLDAVKRHIGHVGNTLNPESMPNGPGKGYGLIKAASGAATHVGLAARAGEASDNLKRHAEHVSASATNAATWAEAVMEKAHAVMTSDDAAAATEMAEEISAMMQMILAGHDDNGDGRVGWGPGEGGLEQATMHLNLLKRGEGLSN
jgi:hypothetical protein